MRSGCRFGAGTLRYRLRSASTAFLDMSVRHMHNCSLYSGVLFIEEGEGSYELHGGCSFRLLLHCSR